MQQAKVYEVRGAGGYSLHAAGQSVRGERRRRVQPHAAGQSLRGERRRRVQPHAAGQSVRGERRIGRETRPSVSAKAIAYLDIIWSKNHISLCFTMSRSQATWRAAAGAPWWNK